MRPIAHTPRQSVFDRIEMDVIDMALKIAVVANGVLPKPALPKRELAIWPTLEPETRRYQFAAEMAFDPPPPAGKICIVRWQCQDGVQVIRKDDDGVDRKWPCPASRAERGP